MSSKRVRRTLMKSHEIQRKFLEENPQHTASFSDKIPRYGHDEARRQAEADLRKIDGMQDEIDNNTYWDVLRERPVIVNNIMATYAELIWKIRDENLMPWFMERHKNVTDLIVVIGRDIKDFTTCHKALEAQHADRHGRCDMADMEFYFRLEAEYTHLIESIHAMLQPYGVYLGNEIDFAIARRARYAIANGLWVVNTDNSITVTGSIDEHLKQLGVETRDVGKMSASYRTTVPTTDQPAAIDYQNAEMPNTEVSGIRHLNETPNQYMDLVDGLGAEKARAASMLHGITQNTTVVQPVQEDAHILAD